MTGESFCDIPIHINREMPVGMMVMCSPDGRQVVPIVTLDIEVDNKLISRTVVGPKGEVEQPKIYVGDQEITGTITTTFDRIGEWFAKITIDAGDQFLRDGQLNRKGRKKWRKDRKKLAAMIRRPEAREQREAYGLAVF